MDRFLINGGKSLRGEVEISGSKNAALPLIFAALSIPYVSVLQNVPDIGDVEVAISIARELGAQVEKRKGELIIDARFLTYKEPRVELSSKIRASTYLLGALLVRFGKSRISTFGGCAFDKRPIDLHLYAIKLLGGEVFCDYINAKSLKGADIYFPKVSVGASINALIVASGVSGTSRIYGYAKEPHVLSLVDFFKSAGVEISVSDEYLEVKGGASSGGFARVIPDMIEAGTYAAISVLTESPFLIKGADNGQLTSFFDTFHSLGIQIEKSEKGLRFFDKPYKRVEIETAPYPGFATDLQPIVAPVLAIGGGGIIIENVWKNRFSYLDALSLFGINFKRTDSYAEIYPSELHAANAAASDLRGGASLIISALRTNGESVIESAQTILRGYENLSEKLASLGADICLI